MTSRSSPDMRLAVFTKNRTNPAYDAARIGAERAAAGTTAVVTHYVPQTPDDPQEQSALIDSALATRPDAFVLSPVHPVRVDAAIQRIAAAGIPVVSFVSPVAAAPVVSHVGADDAVLAKAMARYLFQHLDGHAHVLVVTGPVDSSTSSERLAGFRAAAADFPGIELVGTIAGNYARTTARVRTAEWLGEHPCPDACLVANDFMAIGVLEALAEKECASVVVGVNAIPEAITAISQGRMLATADFNAMQMAFLATQCAIRYLQGQAVPADVQLPVRIVDHANWQEWNLPYGERRLLTLDELT